MTSCCFIVTAFLFSTLSEIPYLYEVGRYVTANDHDQSFSWNTTVEIAAYILTFNRCN